MRSPSFKKKLGFIPLIVLLLMALMVVINSVTMNTNLVWKHYAAFAALVLAVIAFGKNYKVGIIATGLVLLLGLAGLLSFSTGVITTSIDTGVKNTSFKLSFGDPIFLILLILHLILSGKHYFGIGTKKYWSDLFSKDKAE